MSAPTKPTYVNLEAKGRPLGTWHILSARMTRCGRSIPATSQRTGIYPAEDQCGSCFRLQHLMEERLPGGARST